MFATLHRLATAADMRSRHGSTFLEQLVVLTLLGVLLAIATKAGGHLLDRSAVSAAGRDAADAFALAREHAIARGQRTAIRVLPTQGLVVVHVGTDTLQRVPIFSKHRVSIVTSRDSSAYSPTGLGWGAANLRVVLRRGAAIDTLTISRLGRIRRS